MSNTKIQFDRFKNSISTWCKSESGESIIIISFLSFFALAFIMTILPNIGSDNSESTISFTAPQSQHSNEETYLVIKNSMPYGRCSLISSIDDNQFAVSWDSKGRFITTSTIFVLSAKCLAEYLAFLFDDSIYDIPHTFVGYQVGRDTCIAKLSRITLGTYRHHVHYPLIAQCNSLLRKSRGQNESISPTTGKVVLFDIDIKNIGIPIRT